MKLGFSSYCFSDRLKPGEHGHARCLEMDGFSWGEPPRNRDAFFLAAWPGRLVEASR